MLFETPDPDYTASERAKSSFRSAAKIAVALVALVWVIALLDAALRLELGRFGVQPRALAGLPGVLFAPLLHASYAHAAANTIPLFVLTTGMLYLYPSSACKAFPLLYFGPGLAVWLFGATPSVHVGASGLVYGLFSYILVAGILRRDRRSIAAMLLVTFLYGSLVWGVFPIAPGMSWEMHLAGGLIGAGLAVALRRYDVVAPKRYEWESDSDVA